MAGFSRERILHRDRFLADPTEIGKYSPTLSQNIPVLGELRLETGSIALDAGQNVRQIFVSAVLKGGAPKG